MEKIIIDAENAVLGRLATFAAKKALQGYQVAVVNSEKAIIIGEPKVILAKFVKRLSLGRGVQKGPIFKKKPTEIMRRAIRGMLGFKRARGKAAFKRLRCYEAIPEEYKEAKMVKFEHKKPLNFLTLKKLSSLVRHK